MKDLPTQSRIARVARAACLLGALLGTSACRSESVGIGPFPRDIFQPLERSPLLLDVGPPAEPEPAAAPRLRIAGDQLVSLDVRGQELSKAVELIAARAGVNIYLDGEYNAIVDASFPEVTLDDALEAILVRNGLRLARGEGDVFWVERADGNEPALETFQLRSVRAADVAENLAAMATASTVVVDEERNFVLVRGTRGDADAIRSYLTGVDRLKDQVLIEVHLFEVRIDDDFELGVSGITNGTISGDVLQILSNFPTPGDQFSVSLTDDDFAASVEALRRYVGLELLSSPRVLAVTNTLAKVEVVTEIPYVETTTVTSGTTGGVGSTTQEAVQFREAGIKMEVMPTIQEGGMLQVRLVQELSEVIDFFNEIPILDTRKLESEFMVADGQTIVLGGLMQDSHSEVDTGVPLLMHLPLVGHLFKSDEDSKSKRELLVFLTPRILDPAQAARIAPYYKEQFRDARQMLDTPRLDDLFEVEGKIDNDLEDGEFEDGAAGQEDSDGFSG